MVEQGGIRDGLKGDECVVCVQGVQDVPVASSSVKRCLHQSCGYTSGWCTIFSFLGGGFCGLGTAHNGMGDAECEVGNCLVLDFKMRSFANGASLTAMERM